MSAVASVMIALLIHLGGVEIDDSPQARIVRFQEALRTHLWTVDSSERPDTYVLRSDEEYVFVQRLHDPDLIYTVVVQNRETARPVSVAIVSLDAFVGALSRGTHRDGAGMLPVEELLLGWSSSDEARLSGGPAQSSRPEATDVETMADAPDTAVAETMADAPDAADLRANEGQPRQQQTIHYQRDHREVTVSVRTPSDLFILRY